MLQYQLKYQYHRYHKRQVFQLNSSLLFFFIQIMHLTSQLRGVRYAMMIIMIIISFVIICAG